MQHRIEPRNVAGVVRECNLALANKGINRAEVILGLAELLGRVIVDTGSTSIQMDELAAVARDHIERTVRVGAQAMEKPIESA